MRTMPVKFSEGMKKTNTKKNNKCETDHDQPDDQQTLFGGCHVYSCHSNSYSPMATVSPSSTPASRNATSTPRADMTFWNLRMEPSCSQCVMAAERSIAAPEMRQRPSPSRVTTKSRGSSFGL